MLKWIHKIGSPKTAYQWSGKLLPIFIIAFVICFSFGLIGALYLSPPDYQQGDAFRIMFVHVPSAILSLFIYFLMSIFAFIYLIWKIKVADIIFKVSLTWGAVFTALTLITGSLWGKPTWGTYWIWDARLTSELILLFIYLSIIVLRQSIPSPISAAKASALFALVGLVDLPIIHYSVTWWNTLHQGSTLLKLSMPSITSAMLRPLLWMIAAFFLYYGISLLLGMRYELLKREKDALLVKTF